MRIRTSLILALVASCFYSCQKEVKTAEVIVLSKADTQPLADGLTEIKLIASLPKKAIESKREVTFKTSVGNFRGGTGGSIKVKADDKAEVDGKLSAIAYFICPVEVSPVTITASIENFSESQTFDLVSVAPSSVSLSSDAFAVKVNYGGVLTLTTQLISSSGGPVSKNNKIKYEVTDLNNIPLPATFQATVVPSNDKSQASVRYTPGLTASGSFVYVKAMFLDKEAVRDSIKIYLLPQ